MSIRNPFSNINTRREDAVRTLRKAFGEPADSPTLGYYYELPDNVLQDISQKAGKLNDRFVQDGMGAIGSLYAAAGSAVMDFKIAAVGFVVAGSLLAIDAYNTNKAQNRLRKTIFERTL
jgi:hypothetical protein